MKRIIRAAERLFYDESFNDSISILGKMCAKLPYRDPRKQVLADAKWIMQRIKEVLDDKNKENILRDYEIHQGGLGWQVDHGPIDETRPEDGELLSSYYDKNWGLDTIFTEVDKDSKEYNTLYDYYSTDEPLYIGKVRVPVAKDISIRVEIVYVVRCFNNGTTYFTSTSHDALLAFTI